MLLNARLAAASRRLDEAKVELSRAVDAHANAYDAMLAFNAPQSDGGVKHE
jgi:hypothetical protein